MSSLVKMFHECYDRIRNQKVLLKEPERRKGRVLDRDRFTKIRYDAKKNEKDVYKRLGKSYFNEIMEEEMGRHPSKEYF